MTLITEVLKEKWYDLVPQSHITGGDLLPLHHGNDGGVLEEAKDQSGAIPVAFPPPIFAGSDLFMFLHHPISQTRRESYV
jgi:hypothetical protein